MASVRRRKTYVWDKKKATRAKNPRTQDAIVAELEGYICPKCGKKGYPEVGGVEHNLWTLWPHFELPERALHIHCVS